MNTPTSTAQAGVQWFVQTAGVGQDQGYRWLSLDGAGDEALPKTLTYQPVGGRRLVEFLSERAPSVVLGRRADRSYLLCVDGLRHPQAPAEGDYQGRPISTTLLGYAPSGADPRPLLAAAAAAVNDDLVARLPLRWVDSAPVVDPRSMPWTPPALASVRDRADVKGSVGLPLGERARIARDLAAVSRDDLHRFPADRLLILVNELLPIDQIAERRPWRAASSQLARAQEFKEDKRALVLLVTFLLILAGLGLVVLVWAVLRNGGIIAEPAGSRAAPIECVDYPAVPDGIGVGVARADDGRPEAAQCRLQPGSGHHHGDVASG
ncbi:hypothetical protein EDC02_7240 [Micromonospora sp. Llam0]|uniref:hypothetical protein n=1 Tax=Micromonospora sp. Llam0 TaxID=2485143 RepID=UPI000F470BC7|nr:hypothetical protein [Micromonospora sp. Llam0]ROO52318.1 hypothetical protein EDC02_7240 [Micromonospora sp. Llam0]